MHYTLYIYFIEYTFVFILLITYYTLNNILKLSVVIHWTLCIKNDGNILVGFGYSFLSNGPLMSGVCSVKYRHHIM